MRRAAERHHRRPAWQLGRRTGSQHVPGRFAMTRRIWRRNCATSDCHVVVVFVVTADGHLMVGLVLVDVAVPVWVSLVLVNDVNVGRHYEIDASQPLNLLSVRCRFFFCCVFTSIPPRFSPKGERGYVLKRQRQHYPFYKFMFRFLLRFHWLQCALSLTAVISLTSLLFMAKNKIVLKNWRHKYVLSPSKIGIGFCYKKSKSVIN